MRITVRHESGIRSILKKWGAAKLCGEKCFSLGTYNSAPLHYFPQRFCQIRLNLPGEELLDQPFWCKHHRARVRRVSGDRHFTNAYAPQYYCTGQVNWSEQHSNFAFLCFVQFFFKFILSIHWKIVFRMDLLRRKVFSREKVEVPNFILFLGGRHLQIQNCVEIP